MKITRQKVPFRIPKKQGQVRLRPSYGFSNLYVCRVCSVDSNGRFYRCSMPGNGNIFWRRRENCLRKFVF